MTVALVVLVVLVGWLAVALFVVCLFWRATAAHLREVEGIARGLAADLDALSIAGPPPAAVAALTPDDPSLLPAEVEQWLRERTN